jgi:hypothetical protein
VIRGIATDREFFQTKTNHFEGFECQHGAGEPGEARLLGHRIAPGRVGDGLKSDGGQRLRGLTVHDGSNSSAIFLGDMN